MFKLKKLFAVMPCYMLICIVATRIPSAIIFLPPRREPFLLWTPSDWFNDIFTFSFSFFVAANRSHPWPVSPACRPLLHCPVRSAGQTRKRFLSAITVRFPSALIVPALWSKVAHASEPWVTIRSSPGTTRTLIGSHISKVSHTNKPKTIGERDRKKDHIL
jgi:hypothetical protein